MYKDRKTSLLLLTDIHDGVDRSRVLLADGGQERSLAEVVQRERLGDIGAETEIKAGREPAESAV